MKTESNPYSTARVWNDETHAAYASMPKHRGYTAPATEEHREAWRAWFKRTPKHLHHPAVIQAYKELDHVGTRR